LVNSLQDADQASMFHYIINGYDRQTLGTAFTVRFSEKDIAYAKIRDCQLAIDKADLSIGQPVVRGQYEPHLINFYNERLEPGMVFLDIGANIGLFSMLAANIVGSGGKVICFEPNSENCRLILLSIAKNEFKNVTVFPVALGNENGHVLFTTHIGSNGGLVPNTNNTLLGSNCVVVPMMKLDHMINYKVDAIKIDVEGAEGLVVQGAKQLIEKFRPLITSEFSLEMLPRVSKISGRDYLKYFQSIQYDIYLVDRETYALVSIPDVNPFIDGYGELSRIEDLVFIPQ